MTTSFLFAAFTVFAYIQASTSDGLDGTAWYWTQHLPSTPMPDIIKNFIKGQVPSPGSKIRTRPECGNYSIMMYPVKWNGKRSDPPTASPHGMNVEPGQLFLKKNLYPGALMEPGLQLAPKNITAAGCLGFITRGEADSMPPFSYKNLSNILESMEILPSSEIAMHVGETLLSCDEAAANHDLEKQVCTTSLESMVDYAIGCLGREHLQAASTVVYGGNEPTRYVVATHGIHEISTVAAPLVPCHPLPYPHIIYYCHQPHDAQAFRVDLVGEEDDSMGAAAIVVCHTNTSTWDAMYFKMLKAQRGESICHYLPQPYLLWLKA